MPRSKFANFSIGCSMYLIFGIFGSIGMSAYARNKTVDPNMKNTNQW